MGSSLIKGALPGWGSGVRYCGGSSKLARYQVTNNTPRNSNTFLHSSRSKGARRCLSRLKNVTIVPSKHACVVNRHKSECKTAIKPANDNKGSGWENFQRLHNIIEKNLNSIEQTYAYQQQNLKVNLRFNLKRREKNIYSTHIFAFRIVYINFLIQKNCQIFSPLQAEKNHYPCNVTIETRNNYRRGCNNVVQSRSKLPLLPLTCRGLRL